MLIVYIISLIIFGNDQSSNRIILDGSDIDIQYSQERLNNKIQQDNNIYDTVEVSSNPVINARSALVMDFETGTILYEKMLIEKGRWPAQQRL